MKMIRVIKAAIKNADQLQKYMNKGYCLYLDYEGKGKAFLFKKDNEDSGRDILVDFEVAEQFAHDNNLYKDFESEALHYVEYLMESNKDNFQNENSPDETFYFEYYNADDSEWEDMKLTVMQDSESGKFQWIEGDGAEESDFIFNSPKQAIQDYKKFVKSLGNKVRGL